MEFSICIIGISDEYMRKSMLDVESHRIRKMGSPYGNMPVPVANNNQDLDEGSFCLLLCGGTGVL